MPQDRLFDSSRDTDREAAAAYLRKLADRLEAGEQVLPTDGDGTPLAPPPELTIDLRARNGDSVRVDVGLEWASATSTPDARSRTQTGSSSGNSMEDEAAETTETDPHQSTGWASAGASSGYSLPVLESLDDADDEFERAAYFLRKGKREAALSRFERAIERTPRDPRRRYHVATVNWRLDRSSIAARHFEAATELAPEDVVIALEYASFCWSQGRIDDAESVYESALDLAPDDPDVHSALGRFRWETDGDVQAAAEHLTRALDLDDEHGLAHCNYAVLLRHGGKHERAEQHFQRALDRRGSDPIVQKEYGHFLWERGEIEEAAKHYANAE
ncbi:MAG: tetratricopeptide repeat protein [Halapricum sp.]